MRKQRRRLHRPKKPRYNKFLTYRNEQRQKRSFRYKDFSYSDSYNTRFTCSEFSCVNFDHASMKYCGFNGALFDEAEFKFAKLNGSRFKGAVFKNTLFYQTKLDKVLFSEATFENTIFVGSSIKKARGIKKSTPGVQFFDKIPAVEISPSLKSAIDQALHNRYIRRSEVLVTGRRGLPNHLNIFRLLQRFSEDAIVAGLAEAREDIKRDFSTLSYITRYMKTHPEETSTPFGVSADHKETV